MATHYSTNGPICPYCNHQHYPDGPYFYDDSVTELECENCDKTFDVRITTTTTWETQAATTTKDSQ